MEARPQKVTTIFFIIVFFAKWTNLKLIHFAKKTMVKKLATTFWGHASIKKTREKNLEVGLILFLIFWKGLGR